MTREQFIEKWAPVPAWDKREEFESDLNSLFNLRTEEEVREKLGHVSKKLTFYTEKPSSIYKNRKELIRELLHTISLLKWFLKE